MTLLALKKRDFVILRQHLIEPVIIGFTWEKISSSTHQSYLKAWDVLNIKIWRLGAAILCCIFLRCVILVFLKLAAQHHLPVVVQLLKAATSWIEFVPSLVPSLTDEWRILVRSFFKSNTSNHVPNSRIQDTGFEHISRIRLCHYLRSYHFKSIDHLLVDCHFLKLSWSAVLHSHYWGKSDET